jgi:hypothetical protein
MLEADVLWYHILKTPQALQQAEALADAAITVFVNPLNGQIEDDAVGSSAAFNTMLVQGLAMVYEIDPNPAYRRVIVAQAVTTYRDDSNRNGLFGDNSNGLNNPQNPLGLLTEGAILHLFSLAAPLNPSHH